MKFKNLNTKVMILLGAILTLSLSSFSFRASALKIYVTDETEGGEINVNFDYLIANGELVEKDVKEIRTTLEKRAKLGRRTVILLSSPGGYLEMLPDLTNAILDPSNQLYKKTKLSNFLVVNVVCSSACAALMANITNKRDPNALKIFVSNNAAFGFHSPVDKNKKGVAVPIKDQKDREAAIKKQLDFLKKAGVSPDWLRNNESLFRQNKLTDLTGKKLCEDKSLIIPADSCVTDNEVDAVAYVDSLLTGSAEQTAPSSLHKGPELRQQTAEPLEKPLK